MAAETRGRRAPVLSQGLDPLCGRVQGTVVAALALTMPRHRDAETCVKDVLAAARQLSLVMVGLPARGRQPSCAGLIVSRRASGQRHGLRQGLGQT